MPWHVLDDVAKVIVIFGELACVLRRLSFVLFCLCLVCCIPKADARTCTPCLETHWS